MASAPDERPARGEEPIELFPGPTRRLYLVRHGHYVPGGPPDYDGPLSATGRAQATRTAERLRGHPIRVIHCSTHQRARETAAIIAASFPGIEVVFSPLLCECVPSVPPLYKEHLELNVPAAELLAGATQAREAWRRYFQPPEEGTETEMSELLISSGNIIRYFVAQALGAPTDAWAKSDMHNCGLSEVTIKGVRGPLLVRHNDTGHLPSDLQTF